jgi:LacI family transcriptional regulator
MPAPAGDEPRPATLTDVARSAGVSYATASRVLNGSARRVEDEYREKVLKAAKELRYTPNLAAQAVARGRSHVIALVTGGIGDAYFSAMTASVMKAAEGIGMQVSLAVSERRVDREVALVQMLRGQRPRAIILAGTGYVDNPGDSALTQELMRFEETGGRVVLISRTDMPFETVDFDNYAGAHRLASALVARNYRAPLIVSANLPLLSMEERVNGFVAAFREAGIEIGPERIVRPEFSWHAAHSLFHSLDREELEQTDLIFAITDDMALGALAALRERGISVPGDLGLAGFDDITTLRDVVPRLTTVHVPLDEVGQEAVHRATADPAKLRRKVIPTRPILRESTPPRPTT